MRSRRLARSPSLVLGAALLLCAGEARAYCRTTTCDASASNSPACDLDLEGCASRGIPLFWPNRCVPWTVNEDGSNLLAISAKDAETMVSEAAARWAHADCAGSPPSLQFVDQGVVACNRVEFNAGGPNANIVIFRDAEWPHDPLDLALTTVTFDAADGKIHGADIEVNSQLVVRDGLGDQVGSILAHELGHVLGLAHSKEPGALMNADYAADGLSSLGADDIDGVCAVYPPGADVPKCDAAQSFDGRCGGSVEGSCGVARGGATSGRRGSLAILALIVGSTARRRRPKKPQPLRDVKRLPRIF